MASLAGSIVQVAVEPQFEPESEPKTRLWNSTKTALTKKAEKWKTS